MLVSKEPIKYVRQRKNNGKYLQISNCIFTMNSWTDKKIILRCFITTGLFCLHEKFQVYQSSYSRFLRKNAIFYPICGGKYFSYKIFTVLHQSKKELSDLGQNWAKTKQLLLKIFQLLIAMEGCIVHCAWYKDTCLWGFCPAAMTVVSMFKPR